MLDGALFLLRRCHEDDARLHREFAFQGYGMIDRGLVFAFTDPYGMCSIVSSFSRSWSREYTLLADCTPFLLSQIRK